MKQGTIEAKLKKAQNIASELKKKKGYWNWHLHELTGWILHEGTCVYCGADLSDLRKIVPGTSMATDHLLPYCKYPELDKEPLNRVPSCSTCNVRKYDFDPSMGIDEGVKLTREDLMVQTTRDTLIKNAKAYIDKNKSTELKKDRFDEKDRADWLEAMRKWRES
jgi:hypothetical protein